MRRQKSRWDLRFRSRFRDASSPLDEQPKRLGLRRGVKAFEGKAKGSGLLPDMPDVSFQPSGQVALHPGTSAYTPTEEGKVSNADQSRFESLYAHQGKGVNRAAFA